jgi:glycerol uptake facilitator-like aquaporin
MKKYVAEALGAFGLTLVVALSLSHTFTLSTAVMAGLTLALLAYSLGPISGCHINPAVTIGAWSIKKINTRDAVIYIISQFIGAAVAMAIAKSVGNYYPAFTTPNTLAVGFAEAIGAFFFTFGIASVIYAKTPHDVSGLVVGGSLLLGVGIAVLMGSMGMLNPAVAFGTGAINFMYVIGPIVGAVAGMRSYRWLLEERA